MYKKKYLCKDEHLVNGPTSSKEKVTIMNSDEESSAIVIGSQVKDLTCISKDNNYLGKLDLVDSHNNSSGQKISKSDDTTITLTDNVKETCILICEICQKPVDSLRVHAKDNHQLSEQLYHSLFPNIRYQQKTHHRYSFGF